MDIPESYDYFEDRLKPQMKYYSETCKKLQRLDSFLTVANIAMTAFIPVVSIAIDVIPVAVYIVSILGALSSIATGIVFYKKYREQWLLYRFTYEQLKTECARFKTCTGSYHLQDPHKKLEILVTNCELFMAGEHNNWSETMCQNEQN